MSDQLLISEQPQLDDALLLTAWSGWSDAAESATRALRHVVRDLGATKFAEIDAEDFYVFTDQRPVVQNGRNGARQLNWPKNEFFYWKSDKSSSPDIVAMIGIEPNLRWRAYTSLVTDLANAVGVNMLATIGALLDSVPHTRKPRVLCTTIHEGLGPRYQHIEYPRPNYEGPSGMTSATIDAFDKRKVKAVSIWGHAPHYLQVAHNPAITLAIVREIAKLASLDVDTKELEADSEDFTSKISTALKNQPDVLQYVKTLEERYDSEATAAQDPEPAELIDELDAFLRNRQIGIDDSGDSSGRAGSN